MPAFEFKLLPPADAVEFFRQKGYLIGFSWEDVWQQEHQAAFTVAKAMQLDILRDIRAGVDNALNEGTTFETFRQSLEPLLMQKGWWGRADMTDPLTGKTVNVQLGSTRRLKTIYQTNLRTAHSEGQWQHIQSSKEQFPYLKYDANNSEHPRMEHSSWDGLVLPVDHPFWQSHYPVKAWGCKCHVMQENRKSLEKKGLQVSEPPAEQTYTYINKRSGEVQSIPKGVDPSFNYPPGGRLKNLPRMVTDKIIQAPADVGSNWWQTMTPLMAPAIADNYRQFVNDTFARGKTQNKFAVAGVAHPEEVAFLGVLGKTPVSAEIAIQDKLMIGRKAERHTEAGDALTQEEWLAVPAGIANPKAVLYDNETGNLLYIFDSANDARSQKLVVQMDFVTKKPKAVLNMARTAFKLPVTDLSAGVKGKRYEVVRGKLE